MTFKIVKVALLISFISCALSFAEDSELDAFKNLPRINSGFKTGHEKFIYRFRPFIKTSIEPARGLEPIRPINWQRLVSGSELRLKNDIVVSNEKLKLNPNLLITPPLGDVRNYPEIYSGYSLRIVDDRIREGQSWKDVIFNGAGIYAHVEDVDDVLVNIEYIFLFPRNKTTVTGDHEGDIVSLIVVYDRQCERLVRMTYVIHGKVIETFRITYPEETQYVRLNGLEYVNKKETQFETVARAVLGDGLEVYPVLSTQEKNMPAKKLKIPRADFRRDGPWWHSPCNNANVYLAQDPITGKYEHPVAFMEWGTHELWPDACGSITTAPKHNGRGISFLPMKIQMLGSINKPNPEHVPFMFYNGVIGNDPQSPILHRTWFNPTRLKIPDERRSDRDPYTLQREVPWPPLHDCRGNRTKIFNEDPIDAPLPWERATL